ncbi:unnamed protein product, partial [Polarella glacialis]
DELSKNVNAAAKVALRLVSTTGMKHVIRRLCLVSKDPHAHKETAIYTVDSILRHAAVDEELRVKYEKHFQLHLRNLFKRALQMDSTRVSLAEKFFGKILTKWKAKKWFDNELEAIVQVVHNSSPNVPKPATLQPQYLSGRRSSAGSDASGMGDVGTTITTTKTARTRTRTTQTKTTTTKGRRTTTTTTKTTTTTTIIAATTATTLTATSTTTITTTITTTTKQQQQQQQPQQQHQQ